MKNLGLTKERYQQLMSVFGDEETVKEVIKDWTIETCNKGYTIFNSNGTGMLEVCRIDTLEVFENDDATVAQAIKDGIKFIPVEELPENFDRRYLGWIDTPENRKHIEEYCAEMDDSRDR